MSETKVIFVNMSNEKLQEKLDILKKAGIELLTDYVHYAGDCILFQIEKQKVYSYIEAAYFKDPEFKKTNSWREFVLEILKYYYCEVKTLDQANFLHNSTGQGSKCYGHGTYFCHDKTLERFAFLYETNNKKELTFDGFKLLLDSTKENNMQNQNNKTINLELTPQELAFLAAYTSTCAIDTKSDLHQKGVHFMDEFVESGKKSNLWNKLKKPLCDILMTKNNAFHSLYLLEPLFKPEIPLFGFKNGLTTKINNDTVSVGCKTKKPQDWLKYCDQIVELGLDKIEVEGYSFSKVEVDRFREWLKNNF